MAQAMESRLFRRQSFVFLAWKNVLFKTVPWPKCVIAVAVAVANVQVSCRGIVYEMYTKDEHMLRSPKEKCYEDLKLRILRTDLAPGTVLDEVSLASYYGLSRTPLREVMQRLSGSGYVDLAENRGAKVASMDVVTMRTFFQTAPMIYANISRLAAENRTGAQLSDLQTAQNEFAKHTAERDSIAASLSNHKFHAMIGEMAHNSYLSASLDRLLIDHTRLSQTFYRPQSVGDEELIRQACLQHDELIAAIEDREEDVAVELTLKHWDLSRNGIERFVRPDPLPVSVNTIKDKSHAI